MSVINYTAITDRVITVDSEADLEFLLNNIDLTGIVYTIVGKGGFYSLVGREGGPIETPEVAAVFARLTSLSQVEQDAIRKFVNAETANGNWALTDEFFSWGLNATDRLIGFKLVTATNNGATFPDVSGAAMTAVQFIDTNFNPTNNGGILNNDFFGAYIFSYDISAGSANRSLMATAGGTPFSIIRANAANAAFQFYSQANSPFGIGGGFENGSLEINSRVINNQVARFKNGAPAGVGGVASTGIPNSNYQIGNRANGEGWQGTVSTAVIGKGVGFDHVSHYNNLIEYLIDLDTFAGPAIDKAPAAFVGNEEALLRNYINAEVRAGNWQRTDSFFCFSLSAEANAIWDWKRGITGVNVNATPLSIEGAAFNGTNQAIRTAYNPTTDGVNWILADASYKVFVIKKDPSALSNRGYFGGSGVGYTQMFQQATNDFFDLNSRSVRTIAGQPRFIASGKLIGGFVSPTGNRSGAISNGVEVFPASGTGVVLTNSEMAVGARILNGNPSSFSASTIATAVMSSYSGMNHLAQYNNQLNLLIELGVFVTPVLARFANLTAGEIAAITVFVNDEVRNGGWFVTDDYWIPALNNTGSDWLTGLKGNDLTNTNATHGASGAIFNGTTAFMDIGLDLVAGNNYQPLNRSYEAYAIPNNPNDSTVFIGTADSSSSGERVNLAMQATPRVINRVSSRTAISNGAEEALYTGTQDPTITQIYKNGIGQTSRSNAPIPLRGQHFYLGARNQAGVANAFWAGTIPYASIGGVVPDLVGRNTNVRTLLTALGLTLP